MAGEHEFTSAELFGNYATLFADVPPSKEECETLKPGLQEAGFSSGDDTVWQMSDASGSIQVWLLPKSGSFSVMYWPSDPIRLGDAALAALIGKSANVEIENGDEIVVTVGTRKLSHGARTGTRKEYLKFDLSAGAWRETGVYISWSGSREDSGDSGLKASWIRSAYSKSSDLIFSGMTVAVCVWKIVEGRDFIWAAVALLAMVYWRKMGIVFFLAAGLYLAVSLLHWMWSHPAF